MPFWAGLEDSEWSGAGPLPSHEDHGSIQLGGSSSPARLHCDHCSLALQECKYFPEITIGCSGNQIGKVPSPMADDLKISTMPVAYNGALSYLFGRITPKFRKHFVGSTLPPSLSSFLSSLPLTPMIYLLEAKVKLPFFPVKIPRNSLSSL